jgi:hypothetical protein
MARSNDPFCPPCPLTPAGAHPPGADTIERGAAMPSHYADVADTKAFKTAETDTLNAVARVAKAVDSLTQVVNGLPVRGQFADAWKKAVGSFNTISQESKRNSDELAHAIATHGANTDMANVAAAEDYRRLHQAAEGATPGIV